VFALRFEKQGLSVIDKETKKLVARFADWDYYRISD